MIYIDRFESLSGGFFFGLKCSTKSDIENRLFMNEQIIADLFGYTGKEKK